MGRIEDSEEGRSLFGFVARRSARRNTDNDDGHVGRTEISQEGRSLLGFVGRSLLGFVDVLLVVL